MTDSRITDSFSEDWLSDEDSIYDTDYLLHKRGTL